MYSRRAILFLLIATVFAVTHYFAIQFTLYWHFWWFDIVMHFWGGLLLGFGLHALAPLSPIPIQPTTRAMLVLLFLVTVSWEVFEWFAGLYEPSSYVFETSKDIVVGFTGGLLAHRYFQKRYNRNT